MSKPANDNLPPSQELAATGTEIQRARAPRRAAASIWNMNL
jgi:hypothetical protein